MPKTRLGRRKAHGAKHRVTYPLFDGKEFAALLLVFIAPANLNLQSHGRCIPSKTSCISIFFYFLTREFRMQATISDHYFERVTSIHPEAQKRPSNKASATAAVATFPAAQSARPPPESYFL
jgi:hypothetical protein